MIGWVENITTKNQPMDDCLNWLVVCLMKITKVTSAGGFIEFCLLVGLQGSWIYGLERYVKNLFGARFNFHK